jgi:hypothetical protein
MKTVALFFALVLVTIMVGAILEDASDCSDKGGTLVRTALGGWVCVKDAR